MAHFTNTFAEALSKEKHLPKAVVVVPEDNLIQYEALDEYGVSLTYGHLLHYIFSEFNRLLRIKIEMLPKKARRNVHIIWIHPPFHCYFKDNNLRHKFSKALDTMAAMYPNNWSLQLKKVWNTEDPNLYIRDAKRYTATGLMTYYLAIDRTVRFWNTNLNAKTRKIIRNPSIGMTTQ